MVPLFAATVHFQTTEETLRENVPVSCSLPGISPMAVPRPHPTRTSLVAVSQIEKMINRLSLDNPQSTVVKRSTPNSEPRALRFNGSFRFMGATPLPYLYIGTGWAGRAVTCRGCLGEVEKKSGRLRFPEGGYRCAIYFQDEFIEHFQWCEGAQAIWIEQEGGVALGTGV